MAVERDKIDEVLKRLPDELQDEVLKFAESLLQDATIDGARDLGKNGSPSVKAFFGVWDSGDPHSADNDRIESDLTREFSDSHEKH